MLTRVFQKVDMCQNFAPRCIFDELCVSDSSSPLIIGFSAKLLHRVKWGRVGRITAHRERLELNQVQNFINYHFSPLSHNLDFWPANLFFVT